MTKKPKNRDHGRLRRRAEADRGTDSYDLRERLEVSRSPKRDQKIWRAGTKLVGLPDRGVSFNHLRGSCESRLPRLFGECQKVSMPGR